MAGMTEPVIPSVSVPDVAADATVLDVREPEEWAGGHIDGAIHIPLAELPDRVGELPDGPLVVTCRAGGRSAKATAFLRDRGRDATNLDGGMTAWAAAGRDYVRDDGGVPEVR